MPGGPGGEDSHSTEIQWEHPRTSGPTAGCSPRPPAPGPLSLRASAHNERAPDSPPRLPLASVGGLTPRRLPLAKNRHGGDFFAGRDLREQPATPGFGRNLRPGGRREPEMPGAPPPPPPRPRGAAPHTRSRPPARALVPPHARSSPPNGPGTFPRAGFRTRGDHSPPPPPRPHSTAMHLVRNLDVTNV